METRPFFTRSNLLAGCAGLLALWLVALSPPTALAQSPDAGAARLSVGTVVAPPFMMKMASGRWEGLSIELWEELAEALAIEFEWREYENLGELRGALERREIDVLPALAMTPEHEIVVDFSHPYYRSGSAIAVRMEGAGNDWLGVVRSIFSWNVLGAIGFLVLLWIAAGVALWLFERRRNAAVSSDGPLKGVEHGVWWAAVTMTTVGYGDVAPKTMGGRIVATIWMLASIVLIASFTAKITTSLTVDALHGKVRGLQDLAGVRVGALAEAASLTFLTQHGIAALPIQSTREGLQSIVDDELDAFVFDRAVLAHLVRTEFPAALQILPDNFDPYYVGIAVLSGSELREPMDRALLQIMEDESWPRRVASYLGTEPHD
jgi:ABC-type amino acid transport substrate-binding protein